MADILVVDDSKEICEILERFLTLKGYEVKALTRGEEVMPELNRECPDVVVLDIRMPGMSGIELLQEIKEARLDPVVIMLTGYGDMGTTIKSMELGAYEYINKPLELNKVELVIKDALERRSSAKKASDRRYEQFSRQFSNDIVGKHPRMYEIYKTIGCVAGTDTAVLIQGETGTGKELVAKAIHSSSKRSERPFVAVDCSALTETLFESELFGHEKGSFTGAVSTKPGLFEVADGGTIFLDEIGHMKAPLQTKLLRVLQEHEIRRVGDTRARKVDVRVVTATSLDLARAIEEGDFSEELYYRLNVVMIVLPPLRERVSDIPTLVEFFLHKYSERYPGRNITMDSEAIKRLTEYRWPGNVRELENVIEQLCTLNRLGRIMVSDLPERIQNTTTLSPQMSGVTRVRGTNQLDREHIIEALGEARGNISEAARILGVARSTFYLKLKAYGLEDSTGRAQKKNIG